MASGPSFLRVKAGVFHLKEGVSSGPQPGLMSSPRRSLVAAVN